MGCRRFQRSMHRFVDHELNEAGKRRLEQHLALCGPCRGELERLKRLKESLAPPPAALPPARLQMRLLAALRREAQAGRPSLANGAAAEGAFALLLLRRAAAAALLFLAVTAGLFFSRLGPLAAGDPEAEVHYEDLFIRTSPGEAVDSLVRTTTPQDALLRYLREEER